MNRHWREKRQCLSPAFFFALEKAVKSAGNAVIPTFPAHWSHGLQHLRHNRPTFAFVGKSEYTLGFRRKIAHSGSQGEAGRFGWGWYHYPRSVPHVSETLRGRGLKRQTLPLLGLGRVCSRRTQKAFGTAMRSCASLFRRRRGPAGLRDPFSSVGIVACMPCAQGLSACARRGWYHYPRCALRAAETLDGRLSKRLICRFLRLPSSTPCAVTFLLIYRYPCR